MYAKGLVVIAMLFINLETALLLSVTGICWSLAAWLFWNWDIGGYRTDFQLRKKKKRNDPNRGYFPTPWRYA